MDLEDLIAAAKAFLAAIARLHATGSPEALIDFHRTKAWLEQILEEKK